MPRKPRTPCRHRGCRELVEGAYCDAHKRDGRAYSLARWRSPRLQGRKRLYNSRAWQRLREAHLRSSPVCVACEARGRLRSATEVDHVTPHEGDRALFFDSENLQSLCTPCHSRKTRRERIG